MQHHTLQLAMAWLPWLHAAAAPAGCGLGIHAGQETSTNGLATVLMGFAANLSGDKQAGHLRSDGLAGAAANQVGSQQVNRGPPKHPATLQGADLGLVSLL